MTNSTEDPTHMVIDSHRPANLQALAVTAGDVVEPGRQDHEYPGWTWCTNDKRLGGWLPEALLKRKDHYQARVTADFDSRELAVKRGTTVHLERTLLGWAWCVDEAGAAGWVPERCLREIDEAVDTEG